MARSRQARCPPARLAKGTRACLCGAIVTGAENTRRGRRGPGGASQERSFPAAGTERGRGRRALLARAARGPDPATAGGATARRCGSRGAGEGDPPPPRPPPRPPGARARPPRPGLGGFGGAGSRLSERGGGRPVKPGPEPGADGVGAARRAGAARGLRGRGRRRARSGIAPPACGEVSADQARVRCPPGLGRSASSAGAARPAAARNL